MEKKYSRKRRKLAIRDEKYTGAPAFPVSNGVELTRTIRESVPRIQFENIALEILGERYSLSLVLCGDLLARRINRAYRKKNYSSNVLSFSLTEHEGEIFLNVRKAQREAKTLRIGERARIAHLFIHGCLHLNGYRHGQRMEALEQKLLRKFDFLP